MQRTAMVILAAVAAVTVWSVPAAHAGVVISSESEPPAAKANDAGTGEPSGKRVAPRYQGKLFIEGERVRMEGTSRDADGELGGTVLFRAQPEVLLILNDDEKTYFQVTREEAQQIGSAIAMARTQIEAQLENMTPEQRAMMEDALGGLVGGGKGKDAGKPAQPARAIATGATDTVSGHPCRGFDVVRGSKKLAEACVASWEELGLEPADVAVLRKLADFQQKALSEVSWEGMEGAPGAEVFEVLDQMKGFPVRVRTLVDGKRVVMRVVKVERKELDPKLFSVPAGYEKSALPTG